MIQERATSDLMGFPGGGGPVGCCRAFNRIVPEKKSDKEREVLAIGW